MSSPPPKPFHVAIVGGGIGGAVLGVALSEFKHITFTIYESRSAFGEIGAGIAFGANGHLAMKLISSSLWEAYVGRASFNGWPEKQDTWFDFRVGEKGENEGESIIEVKMLDKVTQGTIVRAHFLDELVKLLPDDCAVFNKRLVDVDQSGEKVVCKFMDGTEAEADLVVGCDGIKSGCRPLVYGKDSNLSQAVFTQKVAYRGLVPMKIAEQAIGAEMANNRQMYLGHNGHVLTFPVANGALMNVVAFHTSQSDTWEGDWVQPLQKESLERDFVGWGEKVTRIMEVSQSASEEKILNVANMCCQLIQGPDVWAIFDHPPVSTFHKDRLCLLGDAAHATSPHFGQGAGMAIEDAYVLSNLLGKCSSPAELPAALQGYDFVRIPRALRVTSMSRAQGKLLDMEGDGTGDDLEKLAANLNSTVRWIWNEDLEAHLAMAMRKFEEVRA
jgi:salicylate hydroxylase